MTPHELANVGLHRLASAIETPNAATVSEVFCDELTILLRGKAYRLEGVEETLPALKKMHKSQIVSGVRTADRKLIAAQMDNTGKLQTTHLVTWTKDNQSNMGPYSSTLTWVNRSKGWQIDTVQMSDKAPFSLSAPLSRYESLPHGRDLRDAEDVAEELCNSLLRGNEEQFLKRIRLPFVMQWQSSVDVMLTATQVKAHVRQIQADLNRKGISQIYRALDTAYHLSKTEIYAHFVTYLMKGCNIIGASYRNSMRMENTGSNGWIATALIDPRMPPAHAVP